MKYSSDDNFFMDYAIRLAARNIGNTGENPSVGCVITSNNKIISIGVTGKMAHLMLNIMQFMVLKIFQ